MILLVIEQHHGASALEEIAAATHTRLGSMSAEIRNGCHRTASARGDVPSSNPNANPDHPFYGREVVFTGPLAQ